MHNTSTSKRRLFAVLVTVLIAVGLLSSCSSSSGDDTGSGDNILRVGAANPFIGMDPYKATGGDQPVIFAVYDRLIHVDSSGEFVPGLATAWEFGDPKTLTLSLREGVTFHDGATFDSAAAKASLERAKTMEGSTVAGDLEAIETMQTPDPQTLVLGLSHPDASLVAKLSSRGGAMISPSAVTRDDLDTTEAGAGMFTLDSYTPQQQIKLTAYDNYWDPSVVKLDGLEWKLLPEGASRLNGIKNGELDAAVIDAGDVDSLSNSGADVSSRTTNSIEYILFNRSQAPVNNEKVRQAINYAIDRKAIVDSVVFGQAEPTDQPFSPEYWAYASDATKYDYNPTKAKELLADAGFSSGVDLTMTAPTLPSLQAVNEAIVDQLDAVGIRAKVQRVDGAQTVPMWLADKTVTAWNAPFLARVDPGQLLSALVTDGGAFNPCGGEAAVPAAQQQCSTPEVMNLYLKQAATIDPDQRAEVIRQLVAQVTDQALIVPVYAMKETIASEGVSGLNLTELGVAGLEFRDVSLAG